MPGTRLSTAVPTARVLELIKRDKQDVAKGVKKAQPFKFGYTCSDSSQMVL